MHKVSRLERGKFVVVYPHIGYILPDENSIMNMIIQCAKKSIERPPSFVEFMEQTPYNPLLDDFDWFGIYSDIDDYGRPYLPPPKKDEYVFDLVDLFDVDRFGNESDYDDDDVEHQYSSDNESEYNYNVVRYSPTNKSDYNRSNLF